MHTLVRLSQVANILTKNMAIPIILAIVWLLCSWLPLIIYWAQYGASLAERCRDCLTEFLEQQDPREQVSMAVAILPFVLMQVRHCCCLSKASLQSLILSSKIICLLLYYHLT